MGEGQTHLLGTSSKGYDVLAYLFGGLQVNFKAALVYIPLVYALGISIGLLMGFFGGAFDLIVQRLIEILSNIPFLFVVMIASTAIPEGLKETAGLWIIIGILLLFRLDGNDLPDAYGRPEREGPRLHRGKPGHRSLDPEDSLPSPPSQLGGDHRDLGSVFHFQPRAGLTSLDYLGFGLPAKYATWGQLCGTDWRIFPLLGWLLRPSLFWLVCLSSSPSWGRPCGRPSTRRNSVITVEMNLSVLIPACLLALLFFQSCQPPVRRSGLGGRFSKVVSGIQPLYSRLAWQAGRGDWIRP